MSIRPAPRPRCAAPSRPSCRDWRGRQPLMVALAELALGRQDVVLALDRRPARAGRRVCPCLLLATARHDLEKRWVPPPGRHNCGDGAPRPARRRSRPRELLAHAALGRRRVEPRSYASCIERAGGNPLFLEELAGLLTDVPAERRDGQRPAGHAARPRRGAHRRTRAGGPTHRSTTPRSWAATAASTRWPRWPRPAA